MTQTRTETLALTDGTALRLTVAEPDNVVRGGLVVLHEARGVTDSTRRLVSALAEEGWLTVAPHLYHRDGTDELPEGAEQRAIEHVQRLSAASILADTDAAFVWLADHEIRPDHQGVIGFDIGGTAALLVAANRSLGAAVTVDGRGILTPLAAEIPALAEVAGELGCPWLGLYRDGAERVPDEEVDKLRELVEGRGVATDIVRFTPPEGEVDGEAWQRARNWFDLHLR